MLFESVWFFHLSFTSMISTNKSLSLYVVSSTQSEMICEPLFQEIFA